MKKFSNNVIFLTISLFITMILFYIDEGFYNFQWMKSWGNWVVFGIYTFVFFMVQIAILALIEKFFKFRNQTVISVIVGIPIAIIVLVTIIFK